MTAKSYSIVLVLLLCSLLSCDEPTFEFKKPDIYWGECIAEINDQKWDSCPFAQVQYQDKNALLSIKSDVFNSSGIIVESISIRKIPLAVGTYQVAHWMSEDHPYMLFVYKHHDLALADYLVEEGKDAKGFVSLLEYDSISRDVKGVFECTLYRYRNPGKPDAPDSLIITNGYFHTKIID